MASHAEPPSSGGFGIAVNAAGFVAPRSGGMIDADGIAVLSPGSFLVSRWPGRIWHVAPGGKVTSMLDTEAGGVNQNDLTGVDNLIVVPNWSPGTVTAWRVVSTDQ